MAARKTRTTRQRDSRGRAGGHPQSWLSSAAFSRNRLRALLGSATAVMIVAMSGLCNAATAREQGLFSSPLQQTVDSATSTQPRRGESVEAKAPSVARMLRGDDDDSDDDAHAGPVDDAIDDDGDDDGGDDQAKKNFTPPAVGGQCYSSAGGNPSNGMWRQSDGGISESPVDMVNWGAGEYRYYKQCARKWAEEHAGEGPQPYWKWEPKDCTLDELTEANFCRVMEGRKGILFAGDRLSRIMATSLASALRADSTRDMQRGAENDNDIGPAHWSACGGQLNVAYYRNDFLDTRTDPFPSVHCEEDNTVSRCATFADDGTLGEYDTLVVNAGAAKIWGNRDAYAAAMSTAAKTLSSSMRRLHGDKAIMVVRNTVPGHWDCNARMFAGPVDRNTALALVAQAPPAYEWPNFSGYNLLLAQAFQEEDDAWRLLDVYSPTILRADSHHGLKRENTMADCLHYCVPGPVDHWVTLLYNLLLAETSGDL